MVHGIGGEVKDIKIELNTSNASGEAYWRKRCDVVEAELARLRAVNAGLVEALEKIRSGQHDPAIGEEEPELLEDQVWRYQQWVRQDQDCAIDALSRAEQAGKEVQP